MDIDKFIEFAQKHFTDYIKVFSAIGTLYCALVLCRSTPHKTRAQ